MRIPFLVIFLIVSLLLSITAYFWFLKSFIAPDLGWNPTAWETTGVFGDSFGGLTALFSAFAFAGVVYSLYVQDAHTRVDRFESKFFQMLQAQREIVSGMDLIRKVRTKYPNGGAGPAREVITQGREFFKVIYRQHFTNFIFDNYEGQHGRLSYERRKRRDTSELCSLKVILQIYEDKLFPQFQNDLSHYFRHLFHTVQMVDRAKFLKDKAEYFEILTSQMSTYELLLLFYNCLSEKGNKHFKPLVEKYSLLKSMNAAYLMNGTAELDDEEYSYLKRAFDKK